MINDSVREELVRKISAAKPLGFEFKGNKMPQNKINQPAKVASPKPDTTPKTGTTEIAARATSPTLVEFHNKNATLPEWRLQLQNVVRQHQERDVATEPQKEVTPPVQLITNGANALKAETVAEPNAVQHKNPTLNNALERIEKSRRAFLVEEKTSSEPIVTPAKAGKNYPFHIAAKTSEAVSKPAEINPPINTFAKPKLASSLQTENKKLDTNKLPPIPKPAPIATSFESRPVVLDEIKPIAEEVIKSKIKAAEPLIIKTTNIEVIESEDIEAEEFDDCAPFAMRFNAGLFDLIIGSFTSLFLLSPFMLSGNWLSTAGIFAFLATCAIVMFIYLTTAIGIYGRTFGMRLFSLEIIDIETEDYPSLHQAAVSSSVYLLSLALGGIGFLSIPFNEDKRAVHDLLSGTIIIKED